MTNKKRTKKKSSSHNTVQGELAMTKSGMAFLLSIDKSMPDVIIRPENLKNALHGDTVLVNIIQSKASKKRREGMVKRIVKRKKTVFMGVITMHHKKISVAPLSRFPMPFFSIVSYDPSKHGAVGDKVIVALLTDKPNELDAKILERVSESSENDRAMVEILLDHQFLLSFPDDIAKELNVLSDDIPADEITKRLDCRAQLTFTIDPVDAQDFDDALSIEFLSDGLCRVGVHIADVSHFIKPDTLLDSLAYERGTSVYLPDRVVPMLPEKISNFLCSLRPHEDKLTFSTIFTVDKHGAIKDMWFGKTVIHSNHRFTYEEVHDILEKKEGLYYHELQTLNALSQQLRKERIKKGAINFSSKEYRFQLDESKKPVKLIAKDNTESHQLIEEWMLLANKKIAEIIYEKKVAGEPIYFPYRIHDVPDKDKLNLFIAFARKFGYNFDTSTPLAIALSYNQLLQAVHGKPEESVLSQLGIRTMSKAVYSPKNIGHYGLAFPFYCHFTSPIRRYPDLLVHRIVEHWIQHQDALYNKAKMDAMCQHTSERERAAMEAERDANKFKQVEFMKPLVGQFFQSVISGVTSFGFWVETVQEKCEGLVTIQSLFDYDDFTYVESEFCLYGKRTGRKFVIGDSLVVQLVDANLTTRKLTFEWQKGKK
ncbi:MAG: ribonuclease R [Phycisphaerales bacterium]|nr:ribonuclease R [Phycisphaerales bacterium]